MSIIRSGIVITAVVLSTTGVLARSLCPLGTEALCVPLLDKICTNGGKCVSQETVCFEKTACNYEGFACKSDLNKAQRDAGFWETQVQIMRKNDTRAAGKEMAALQADYDSLSAACKLAIKGFADKQKSCANPYDAIVVQNELDKLKDCIRAAPSIEAAKQCVSK